MVLCLLLHPVVCLALYHHQGVDLCLMVWRTPKAIASAAILRPGLSVAHGLNDAVRTMAKPTRQP